MGLIKAFFFLPSKKEFLNDFSANEHLQAQAANLWRQLDEISLILLIVTAILSFVPAIYYYMGFCNSPGRHYQPKYWAMFFLGSVVACFFIPLALEYGLIKQQIKGVFDLYACCASNCALYGLIAFLLASFIMCNIGKNNAYKVFKL